jgi:Tfp pilus assembly protein PilX
MVRALIEVRSLTECPCRAQKSGKPQERGSALIITLLLLMLMGALSLAMVLSVNSDSMINGYYRNYRGSFYAADSGLNITRQYMLNQIEAAVPATFSSTTAPIPAGTDAVVQSHLLSAYGSNTKINTGPAKNSWNGSFQITSASLSLITAPPQPVTIKDGTGKTTGYQYTYNYTLTSQGQAQGSEQATIQDQGTLLINATLIPGAGSTASFAAWGMFIDQYNVCSGSYLVPGTISGPVFTNGGWTFGTTGSYIFTDTVGSHSTTAGYQFSSKCDSIAASSDSCTTGTCKGQSIKPTYQSGSINLAQPTVPLPPNDYSQERAVLDGKGSNTSPVTKSDLNGALLDVSGNPYPTSGASSGVFIPYTVSGSGGSTTRTFSGGGFYVEGNAAVTLSISGTSQQIYTIKQGSTTTTITVDMSANTTTVSDGSTSITISGVPVQKDPSTGAVTRDATMLYVDGSVTSLTGPHDGSGNSLPAVQDASAISVVAASNITVTGDLLYKSEPVTETQNQIPGTPADTLIPGNDHGQVLGLFTAGGNIYLSNSQSSRNLEIDASIATLSSSGGGTSGKGSLINNGAAINTLTIVGGRIQNTISNINSTTRNVYFDRRFASGGFAPPWFPSTALTGSGTDSANLSSSVQRTRWVVLSSQ